MTGTEILKLRDQLKTTRTPLENHWDELSEMFMPFRLGTDAGIPNIPSAENINDSTGRTAALVLANGLASLLIPREDIWFEWMPPKEFEKDENWVSAYREASVVAREFIERSEFYENAQEFLIESPVFGTACVFVGDVDDPDVLYFKHQGIKTYYIAEDARGRVNMVVRELMLTPDQAAGEFGADKLPQEVASKVGKPEGLTIKTKYVHCVMPATELADDDAPDSEKGPYQSYVVVDSSSKRIVQKRGYGEFPFMVHRYRKFGSCVWGFGPGSIAVGDARQLDFIERLADAATEKAVFPPLVASAGLEGEIGQGALEVTFLGDNEQVREMSTVARMDLSQARLIDKRAQLNNTFHTDLFQMFSRHAQNNAQPLAVGVANLMQMEKLIQFAPAGGRFMSEFLNPLLTRVFGILLRRKAFGPKFDALLVDGKARAPEIRYKNRIVLAMQQLKNQSLVEFLQLAMPLIQMDPTMMDPINSAQIIRDTARNAGFSEDWIRSKEGEAAIKEARAQALAMQQKAALAESLAKTGKDLSQTTPEVREGLASQM
jgi:Bacteriophage head to tail connecting protein